MNLLLAHLRLANLIERELSTGLAHVRYSFRDGSEVKRKALTPIQALTLAQMLEHSRSRGGPEPHPMRATELALPLGGGGLRTTVQACLAPLIKAGLVEQFPDASDKRLVGYALTEAGRQVAIWAITAIGRCDSNLRGALRDKELSWAWRVLSEICLEA
jgi:DNA-binding MarR family transcriptional regulator